MDSPVLDAPLPARWSPLQRLKNTIIYGLVRALAFCLVHTPFVLADLGCSALGWIAALVAIGELRRADAQLAIAFPELAARQRRRIARAMFVHLGRSLAEASHLDRFLDGARAVRLDDEQRALLDAAVAEGKGVVAVTGHIGNWELVAQVLARAGYPLTSIAKPLYDPRLTRWVHKERTARGMHLVWRGDGSAGKDMLRVFKQRGVLALLIDQDTRVQGVFVPFFGRLAHTPSAAAALALRFDAPVIIGWGHRRGGTHALHFERLHLPASGDRDADTLALTAAITARLEAAIRICPEQWVWLHRRWKQRPDDVVRQDPGQPEPAG